jgi:hypothetical protein
VLVADRSWLAGPQLIQQTVKAICRTSRPPFRGHLPTDPQPLGDVGVLHALGRQQHDPRALRQRLRTGWPARPRLQLRALLFAQLDDNDNRIRYTPFLPP